MAELENIQIRVSVPGAAKAKTSLDAVANSADRVKEATAKMVQSMQGAGTVTPIAKSAQKTTEQVVKLRVAVAGVGRAAKPAGAALKRSFNSIGSSVKRLAGQIKRILLYRLIKDVIKWIKDAFKTGMENMYYYSQEVGTQFAKSMDMIATSMLYLKNSIGAMVAPLVNVLAPAIDFVTDKFVDFLNILNQTIAKMSGAQTWTKAIKYPVKYKEATDAASKANKKFKATILAIDEINPLNDNSDNGKGSGNDALDYSKLFEEVSDFSDVLDSSFLGKFFEPFRKSWETNGENVMKSFEDAWLAIQNLAGSVSRSIETLFDNGTVQTSIDLMLNTLINSNGILTAIVQKHKAAFEYEQNGTSILQAGANVLNGILSIFERISKKTKEWTEDLNIIPLLTATRNMFDGIAKNLKPIGDVIVWVWETILLPVVKWATEVFMPFITNTFEPILSIVADAIAEVFSVVSEAWGWISDGLSPIGDAIGKVFDMILGALRGIKETWEELKPAIDSIKGAISKIGERLGPLLKPLSTIIGWLIELNGGILSGSIWFLTKIGEALTWIAGVVADVVSYLTDFIPTWEQIKTAFSNAGESLAKIWDGIVAKAKETWNKLPSVIKNALTGLATWLGERWNYIRDFAVSRWNQVKEKAKEIWGKIPDNIKTPIINVANWLNEKWTAVHDFAVDRWNKIKAKAKEIWGNLPATIQNALTGLETWLGEKWNKIRDFAADRWNQVKNKAKEIWDKVPENIKAPLVNIASWFSEKFNAVKNTLSSVWTTIGNLASEKWGAVKKKIVDVMDGIKTSLKAPINGIISGIEFMVNKVIDGVNVMIRALNKIKFSIPDWVPGLGGKSFGFSIGELTRVSIPRMAEGGIAQSGSLFLAGEAGPEMVGNIGKKTAVANTSQMVDAIAGGVAMADAEGNALLREQNNLLRALVAKEMSVEITTSGLTSALRRNNQVAGRTLVPVGG